MAAAAASVAVVSAAILAVLVNIVAVPPIGIGAPSPPGTVEDSVVAAETVSLKYDLYGVSYKALSKARRNDIITILQLN